MENNKTSISQAPKEQEKSHWFLWVFYYNPDDNRLMPPKRIKWLGWTINFANPYSIAFNTALIIALITAVDLYFKHK